MIIFDFSDPETIDLFAPIDDQVMGGISASRMLPEGDHAVFAGDVSLENFGGFASVRSFPGHYDLGDYEGVELKARGDGKSYKLSLTTDMRFDSVVYRARFTPPGGEWSVTKIPFTGFDPTFRGDVVSGAPPLDVSGIVTFGFLISDKQEGPFRLELRSIGTY
jgi:NADH dehydrogenase [ubiquinone] 1 alpha subcomplex assembly factor 1